LQSRADRTRAEIIRFWRTVEMFSPPEVKKVSRGTANVRRDLG
jgi:hypothetical protein